MNENRSPVVSIVMATFNREHLLIDTLAAILSQNYRDFELLIVDDGSTDNTQELLYTLQQTDERIHYLLLNENRGVGFARNYGIKHARGRYIAMVDSDDHWLPGKLAQQVDIMERYPFIDFLFADYMTIAIHAKGASIRGFELTANGLAHLEKIQLEENLWFVTGGLAQGILVSNFIATSTVFVKRDVITLTKGYKDSLRMSEDLDFYWRAALSGAKFAYWDQVIQVRRVYSDSITQGNPLEKAQAMLQGAEILRETCLAFDRNDLLPFVDSREQYIWRKLLLTHGKENSRRQIIDIYRRTLRRGFSLRTFRVFVVALIGSRLISYLGKKQTLSMDSFAEKVR